ncbi:acetylcholine receptor subunit alpha-like [Ylistrum balloti]|uniref:acetylcholine receptor subunit alpha-like n=1 Tax=Ylistrum balloti TaxID=509963 RepID=UPI002905BAB0|nr:acetylcholine receptor subunit alpha-like [Ylistrum balloti]
MHNKGSRVPKYGKSVTFTDVQLVQSGYTSAKENALRTLLFTTNSYQIQARPASKVDVNITCNVLTFNSLDVRAQSLTTTGYFDLSWSDARLSWSSNSAYNNDIYAIYSDEDTVWRPPLIMYNSVKDISVMSDDAIPLRVQQDGTVSWTPSGIYETMCETDVTFYPFDTQVCDITVSTWGYTSTEITLNLHTPPVDTTYYTENGEWEFNTYYTSSSTKSRRGKSFSSVTFHMSLKRRPMYHVLNTLIPTILLAFLSCLAFKLPPDSGERIGYCLTVLLSYAVYLTLVSTIIPTTSVNTSLLSVYLVFILAMGMVSVLLTIIVLECHHTDPDTEIPKWIIKTLNILMTVTFQEKKTKSSCCCSPKHGGNNVESLEPQDLQPDDSLSTGSNKVLYTRNSTADTNYTWIEIGQRLDKSFLRLFLFIVLISTLAFTAGLGIGYATN